MKKIIKKVIASALVGSSILVLAACGSNAVNNGAEVQQTEAVKTEEQVVNLYTDRHYDTDQELFDQFETETGIKVNVVTGKSDELIERLTREGEDTEADLLITADVGRLYNAKETGLLQSATSETLEANVPENFRDADNQWYGLTVRGRVIVYSKDRVDPSELSTYDDLTTEKWNGKVLVRSSENIYNLSLLASFIAINGEEAAKEWAAGIVNNMAREPEGNDRDQATAVVAGEGDVAIMNTYYLGKMLTSTEPEEVKVAENVGVFFPDQEDAGTHINISGVGVTKYSKNKQNAIKLMEFLSGKEAQKVFAEGNFEYPVNPEVEPSELLKSWGDFKAQDIDLSLLGEYNATAAKIFNEVGWK
ncbi:Fe(3+) ABC transporter substrate-binding protein [Clostridium grantii]|uniref:Iron(III) transport system substrate-binding protein n=1 Tax=Clostridium grantii DSM 8605 TaxID=1121316 RepID=A0A1M5X162_9CLOT|nr:Fe(3+) ABC transporter substrate-binding protein [Clostridium grantii]SHH93278.1 iron(III) transport system substrate-binding protein [Clostridium grantii DSM 8605]